VTVGSSLPHDKLILEIDSLKAMGHFRDHIIYAQIGNGKYIPKKLRWKRFVGNMSEAYERADLIISSCGAATILENVVHGRRLIVVQNPDVTGGHEWELVSKMEKLGCLLWCKKVEDILDYINKARDKKFNKFIPDKFDVSPIIRLIEGG
jgi:UDP-N-acetylglucosamine transferase subunit ALG13